MSIALPIEPMSMREAAAAVPLALAQVWNARAISARPATPDRPGQSRKNVLDIQLGADFGVRLIVSREKVDDQPDHIHMSMSAWQSGHTVEADPRVLAKTLMTVAGQLGLAGMLPPGWRWHGGATRFVVHSWSVPIGAKLRVHEGESGLFLEEI